MATPQNGLVWNKDKIQSYSAMMAVLDQPMPKEWLSTADGNAFIRWEVLRDKLTAFFGVAGWKFEVDPQSIRLLREQVSKNKEGKEFTVTAAAVSGTLSCQTPFGTIVRSAVGSDIAQMPYPGAPKRNAAKAAEFAVKNATQNCLKHCASMVGQIFRASIEKLPIRNDYAMTEPQDGTGAPPRPPAQIQPPAKPQPQPQAQPPAAKKGWPAQGGEEKPFGTGGSGGDPGYHTGPAAERQ